MPARRRRAPAIRKIFETRTSIWLTVRRSRSSLNQFDRLARRLRRERPAEGRLQERVGRREFGRNVRARHGLIGAGDLDVDLRDAIDALETASMRNGSSWRQKACGVTVVLERGGGRACQDLWQRGGNVAAVGHQAARAETARQRQVGQPRGDVDVVAVPVLGLLAELRREGVVVVEGAARHLGFDVVEARDGFARRCGCAAPAVGSPEPRCCTGRSRPRRRRGCRSPGSCRRCGGSSPRRCDSFGVSSRWTPSANSQL